MSNPTLVSAALSDTLITDADDANSVTLTLTFSEAMESTGTPTINFGAANNSLINAGTGTWSPDNTVYTITYEATDDNFAASSVTVTVTDVTDADGNPINTTNNSVTLRDTGDTADVAFDTANPVPTFAQDGDGLFTVSETVTITLTFGEAVTVGGTPQLNLSNGGVATYSDGHTSNDPNNGVLVFQYTVLNTASNETNIEVTGYTSGTITDANGNAAEIASSTLDIEVDTVAPSGGDIAIDSVTADSGTLTNGAVTNDTTLVIAGTTEPGAFVEVFDGTTSLGTVTADGNGDWSYSTSTLSQAAYDFNVQVTDAAGNTSVSGDGFSVTVDTTAPLAPTLSLATDTTDGGSGHNSDGRTSDATVNVANIESGATVEYQINGESWQTLTGSSFELGSDDDAYVINVRQTDAAGNVSDVTNSTYTLDTNADVDADLSIVIDGDGVVSANEDIVITVSGLDADASGTLTVTTDSGTTTSTVDVSANGQVTVPKGSLPDGPIVATFDVEDATGNMTQATANSVILDQDPPAISNISFNGMEEITDTDVGSPVTLTITFDEAMDTDVAPSITFPNAGSSLALASGSGSWNMDGTVYSVEVDVYDQNVAIGDVTVDVSGAQDIAGNTMVAVSDQATGTQIDTANPVDVSGSTSIDEYADPIDDASGDVLATFSVTDSGDSDTLTYALGGTGGVYDAVSLNLNSSSGVWELSVLDPTYFDLETSGASIDIDVTATDDAGNTTTSTFTVNLNDINDNPVSAETGTIQSSVDERMDGAADENATPFGVSGTFDLTDDDADSTYGIQVNNVSTTASGGGFVGFLSTGFDDPLDGDGAGTVSWDFRVGSPLPAGDQSAQMAIIDALSDGESIVQVYEVVISDGVGGSVSQLVEITISGTNDLPVITGSTTSAPLTEVVDDGTSDQTLFATGTLSVSDTDTSDVVDFDVTSVAVGSSTSSSVSVPSDLTASSNSALLSMMALVAGDGSSGSYSSMLEDLDGDETAGSDFTWKFEAGDMASSPFDFLAHGETLELVYTLTATDSAGATVPQDVTITITGTNDVPAVTGVTDPASAIAEDGDSDGSEALSASGSISVQDADLGNTLTGEVVGTANADLDGTDVSSDGRVSALIANSALTFDDTVTSDGTVQTMAYSYAVDPADIDFLRNGETLTLEFTVRVGDGSANSANATETVTITITGTNDVPVIDTASTASAITEDTGSDGSEDITASGTLAVTDQDHGDTLTGVVVGTANADLNGTDVSTDGRVSSLIANTALHFDQSEVSASDASVNLGYSYSVTDADLDFLAAGDTLTLTFTVEVGDDQSGTSSQSTVTITITGTNDVPTISASSTAPEVSEAGGTANGAAGSGEVNGDLSNSGANWTDRDAGEDGALAVTQGSHGSDAQTGLTFDGSATGAQADEAAIEGTYGTLFIDASGGYRYVLDEDRAATQALEGGAAASETFNYTIANNGGGTGHEATSTLTVSIMGTNDAPVITVTGTNDAGAVEEAGVDGSNAAFGGTPSVTGSLSADDVDAGEGSSGTALTWGVTPQGSSQSSNGATEIAGQYGTFTIDQNGEWTFTLSNGDADVEALHDGESVTETFDVVVHDDNGLSHTQTVTITIAGTNDAPVIAVDSGVTADADVTEAGEGVSGDTAASGAFTSSDVDMGGSDQTIWSISAIAGTDNTSAGAAGSGMPAQATGTYGTLTLNDDGTWSYALDDTDDDTQALAGGVTVVDVFTVRVADGLGGWSELDVTVSITGTNDAPVIEVATGGSDSQAESVTETDGGLTSSGTLTVSDVDAGDSVETTVTGVSATGTLGDFAADDSALQNMLTITSGSPLSTGAGNASGSITWSFVSGSEAFDFLAAGESLVLAYTVEVGDGDTTNTIPVTVTINGTNDQPVISVDTGDSDAATLAETTDADGSGDLATSGTLTLSDDDGSDTHTVTASLAGVSWEQVSGGASAGTIDGSLTSALESAFSVAVDGSDPSEIDWSFTLADFLAAGEQLVITYDVTANDGKGSDGSGDDENSTSDAHTVTITITGTNDVPVIDGANTDAAVTGNEGTVITGTVSATDPDEAVGLTYSVAAGDGPANGTVTIDDVTGDYSYTPAGDFNGTDSFTVTITDDQGATVTPEVMVTVDAINDPTELDISSQNTPTHSEGVDATPPVPTLIVDEVTLVDVDALDYDGGTFTAIVSGGDGTDALAFDESGVVSIAGSTLSVNGTAIGIISGLGTFSISVAFNASAMADQIEAVIQALTYATTDGSPALTRTIDLDLSDGDGADAQSTSVDVNITAFNDTPTPTDDAFSVSEGTFSSTNNLVSNDSDPDQETITVSQVVDIDDATGNPLQQAVVNGSAGVITTDWGAEVTLQANGQLFYNLTSNSARFNELAAGETAVDSFEYTVEDSSGATQTATVQVTIVGVNDAIVAVADTIDLEEGDGGAPATHELNSSSGTFNLLLNDDDADKNDTASSISVAGSTSANAVLTPSGYEITLVPSGVVITLQSDGTYSTNIPESLDESETVNGLFQYTVQDNGGAQSTATVTISVTGTNDAVEAANVTLSAIVEDTSRVITQADLLVGVTDADETTPTITSLSIQNGNGTLIDNGDGTWTYTPALDDDSSVTFAYTSSDGPTTASSTASMDITAINDGPVAQDADFTSAVIDEGGSFGATLGSTTYPISQFASDIDSTLGAASFSFDSATVDGAATSLAGAGISYDPSTGAFALDGAAGIYDSLAVGEEIDVVVSFTVTDDGSLVDTGTATFRVRGTNDTPVVVDTLTGAASEGVHPSRLIFWMVRRMWTRPTRCLSPM